tara:strand:- start:22147 stop:29442 length:7296 start_codon:yes stop_codon:yes gene_type:complete
MAINLDVHGNTQPLEAAVQAAVNRIRRTPIKVTVDDKGATQPLGNMKRGADEFSKSMEAANARIIAFGASMAIMNGVANSFKAVVANAVEVEKALADINVVMGLTASNLDKFSDGLFKVAKETGAAFNIAAQAATEYARQGLGVEESLKRTRDALILTRLTGMDSAQGVKALTAAMNTYGKEIKDTTQLVSKFAAVDVKFAVSAEDFADAIARTGQAAKSAGVNIDELIGLVTAAQQQTARGGKVIGNSFKTIFTRIGRTDTLNQLENLGIAVRDLEGNTLGAKRILTDLANSFDHLSEAQKAQIAQTVGGVFQINVLKAVLSDAAKQNGILANATQISAGATDEAIQKNEQLRQTMAAMATETGLALKDVSARVGEIMLGPGIEKILNVVKSIADGANNLLGEGEGAGSKFANGFLKGLGNVITGPGLVVITVVFGKLFLKAAQFAKESLVSLIGVTSEAQKQKAIQSSLVALFGRSASLSKEMLSTETTKAQKEQIILNLLKAQVAEAQMLDSVAKRAASTLYKQGYNAGLAPRSGRRGASGYIPNFAHPERQEAAQGGYAAGNIRSMNMPGGGSVIYNSAEKVKNFAGFTQPAIMPPLSSKAGKNYQQAFGSVHGFDPYAGSGYVPNFAAKIVQGDKKPGSAPLLNAINFAHMLTPSGGAHTVTTKPDKAIYGVPVSKLPRVRFKSFGIQRGASTKAENKKKDIAEQIFDAVEANAIREGRLLADSFKIGTGRASGKTIKQSINSGESGGAGALQSVVGALFEAAISTKIKQVKDQSGGIAGVAQGIGGDFDLRNPNQEQRESLKLLFGGSWSKTKLADYKGQFSDGNAKSMAEKILKEKLYRQQNLGRGNNPALAFAGDKVIQLDEKQRRILGPRRGARMNARGYIPNFADPLSDAIGREKGAGVPVSQIRVGTHQSLIGKGNPLGIGVTNTKDEPNGLRDVFGADGHVPNYAFRDGASRVISNLLDKWKSVSTVVLSSEKQRELVQMQGLKNQQRFTAQEAAEHMKGLGFSKQETRQSMLQLNYEKQETNEAMKQVGFSRGGSMGAIGNLNSKVGKSAFGKFMGGGGGMGAMMGLSMIGGMLPGASTPGSAGNYASSAMSYASTGMMMGSMAGPFAPIAMAIGGLGGALYGLSQASDEASKALREKAEAEAEASRQHMSSVSQGLAGPMQQFGLFSGDQDLNYNGMNMTLSSKGMNRLTAGGTHNMIRSSGLGEPLADDPLLQTNLFMAQKGGEYDKLSKRIQKLKEDRGFYKQGGKYGSNQRVEKLNKAFKGTMFEGKGDEYNNLIEQRDALSDEEKRKRGFFDAGGLFGNGFHVDNIEGQLKNNYQSKMATGFRRQNIKQQFGSLPSDYRFDIPALRADKARDIKKGETRSYNSREFLSQVDDLSDKEIRDLDLDLKKLRKKIGEDSKKEAEGLIIQLNTQKAIISAQNQVRLNLLDISDKYKSQISDLDIQGKIIGDLMTERQKTELKYNKAILKNTEAEEKAKAQANLQFRQGVFTQLGNNKPLEQELKRALLDDGVEVKGGSGATTVDVTDALSDLPTEKLIGLFEKIKEENKDNVGIQEAINRLAANELLKRQGLIDAAERTKTLSDDQAEKEKDINFIIDQRTQKVKDLAREINLVNNLTDQAMKGLAATEKTQDARRSFASAGVTGIESQFLAGKQGRQISANRNMRNLALGLGKNMNSLDQEYRKELLDQRDADRYAISGPDSAAELDHMMALIEAETERTKKLDEYEQKRSALVSTFESERLSIDEILQLENERNKIITERALLKESLDRSGDMLNFRVGMDQSSRSREQEIAKSRRLTAFGSHDKTRAQQMAFDMNEMDITTQEAVQQLEESKKTERFAFNAQRENLNREQAELQKLRDAKPEEGTAESDRLKILQASERSRLKTLSDIEFKKQKTLAGLDEEIEKTKTLNEEEKKRMINQEKHNQSFTGGLRDGMTRVRTDAAYVTHKLGEDLPIKLRDGLAEAMGAAINGADDLGDVLRDVAMGFLQTIQQAMLQKAAGHMIGAMGFSKGGQVPGRVPAMVTNGEYIMNKDAVNKYGGGFMHSLNARGRLPSYSTGGPHKESAIGMNFAGSEGFQTGRRYQSEKMSGFFYSGQAGNVGLQEDTSSAREIIQERIRRAAEKKAKKQALLKQIVGTVLSVGISHGIGSMMSSAASSSAEGMMSAQGIPEGSADFIAKSNGMSTQQAQSVLLNAKMNDQGIGAYIPAGSPQTSASLLGPPAVSAPQSSKSTGLFGGFVENMFGPGSSSSSYWGSSQKAKDYRANIPQEDIDAYKRKHGVGFFASGGFVSGKSGIDQIPAMLSEGEYVIKASSARRLGPQTLNAINTGRFNDGGAVTPISEKTESGISGGNTNNISISVNIDKSGGSSEEKSDSKSSDPKKASDDQTKEKALSEKLKEQVVATILEEQRPGGLLAKD